MRFLRATVLVACLTAVTAFKDTSPYLLFSTSEYVVFPRLDTRANAYSRPLNLNEASSRQLRSAANVLRITKEFLSGCPSDIYVILSQPNLNVADFSSSTALPRLQRFVSRSSVKTKIQVSEVIGELSTRDLEDYLKSHCGAAVIEADQISIINLEARADSSANKHPIGAGISSVDSYSRPLVIRRSFTPLPRARSEREAVLENNGMV
jgi:hypothetical protein